VSIFRRGRMTAYRIALGISLVLKVPQRKLLRLPGYHKPTLAHWLKLVVAGLLPSALGKSVIRTDAGGALNPGDIPAKTPVIVCFNDTAFDLHLSDASGGGRPGFRFRRHRTGHGHVSGPDLGFVPGSDCADGTGDLHPRWTGQGHATTINQNGLINSPADGGDVITLFVTGIGKATSAVTIHGFNLSVIPLSVGTGTVPGVMQIKVPIPGGQDCDTTVVVQVGNASSRAMFRQLRRDR
jgi:hypothetical protein